MPRSTPIFNRIAKRYDFTNTILSFGLHYYWRRALARAVASGHPSSVLDVATGTGDVMIALKKMLPKAEIMGIDPSIEMINIGREKTNLEFIVGSAEALPIGDQSFDAVTISFGIRNVVDVNQALKEMRRVLTPGGQLFILEFSLPKNRFIRQGNLFYRRYFVPIIGRLITGDHEAYRYLNKTIETFPYGAELSSIIEQAGFSHVEIRPLTFGIVTLYVCYTNKKLT